MRPWIDRKLLIEEAKKFVKKNGYFFRQNANRIGTLVEITVYNSIVTFYKSKGFSISAENLGPKKSFKYKLSPTGLSENFSFFTARSEDGKTEYCIFHNTRLQSAHNPHLYFTADVAVCSKEGAITQRLKSGRRHSFISNEGLMTFAEVKHLMPFPEVLFSFSGLVLEFLPDFISGKVKVSRKREHLCPLIIFTGMASDHTEAIQNELNKRYGINVVFGTCQYDGKIADFATLNKYSWANKSLEPDA